MNSRPICGCGFYAKVFISWTDANPGRRFAKCRRSRSHMSCTFWKWMDPALPQHYRDVINGFIQTQDILKDQIADLKAAVARLEGHGIAQPLSDGSSFMSEVDHDDVHPQFYPMQASSHSIMESVVEASASQNNATAVGQNLDEERKGSEFLIMMIISLALGLFARFMF